MEATARLPIARAAHALQQIGGKLYAAAGANGSNRRLRDLFVYDLSSRTWKRGPRMRVGRNHVASAVLNGKLYVIGGRPGPDAGNLRVVERYNPAGGHWRTLAPLEVATSGAAAAVAGGAVVVFGGEKQDGSGETVPATEAYDPATGTWTALADMLTPRHGLGGASYGNRVFALEGGPIGGLHFSTTNEYLRVPYAAPNRRTRPRPAGVAQSPAEGTAASASRRAADVCGPRRVRTIRPWGSSTNVVGRPLRPKSLPTWLDPSRRFGYVSRCWRMKAIALAVWSFQSTPTSRALPWSVRAKRSSSGASCLQGAHQLAQKLTSAGRPRSEARSTLGPRSTWEGSGGAALSLSPESLVASSAITNPATAAAASSPRAMRFDIPVSWTPGSVRRGRSASA